MLNSLKTNYENASESRNATGASAFVCVYGTAAIDCPLRNRPDMTCPGILADYVTEWIFASNDESWVRATSAAAHDLPWGSDSCRVSVLDGGDANRTLSQRCSMRDNTDIHCRLVRNCGPWSQSDGDVTSSFLEENVIHCAPFPSTVSGTFGLFKGKGVWHTHLKIKS